MKHIITKGLIAIAWIWMATACDQISQDEFVQSGFTGGGQTTVKKKIVLLEDFTGHQCGNCPRAHETAETIANLYGDQVVILSIHAGFFARTDNKYSTDYTTETGDEIDGFFGASSAGLPQGMVNRVETNGSRLLSHTAWASQIQTQLGSDPVVFIGMENTFNQSNRTLTANLSVEYLQNLPQGHKLAVYLAEDKVTSLQKDYDKNPQDIDNYNHKHVLRASLNGTWGDDVEEGEAGSSDFTKTYTYTIPSDWVAENCEVIAFVYNADNYEVLQAQKGGMDETTDNGGGTVDPNPSDKNQVVLIEKFTGHQCGICPAASARVADLETQYPGQIAVIKIHAGFFAQTNHMYNQDFTTEAGNEIAEFFDALSYGVPQAMINRQSSSNGLIKAPENWANEVAQLVNRNPLVYLSLTNTLDTSNYQLTTNLSMEYNNTLPEGHKISLFITESKIRSPQKDFESLPVNVIDYEHNHVLRDAINSVWGDDLPAGNAGDDNYSTSFQYSYHNEWKVGNVEIIAIIYDSATNQIIQAQKGRVSIN